jgi:NADPH-ferrihemoprotein reductase
LLQAYEDQLGDSLKIITAFSREGSQKVYVQHRLREHAELVSDLLKQKATFYVCGDAANMAREVNLVLGQIIAQQRGLPAEKGEEMVKHMRSSGSYQEDVWS